MVNKIQSHQIHHVVQHTSKESRVREREREVTSIRIVMHAFIFITSISKHKHNNHIKHSIT